MKKMLCFSVLISSLCLASSTAMAGEAWASHWLANEQEGIQEDYDEAVYKIEKTSLSKTTKNLLISQAKANKELALKQAAEKDKLQMKHKKEREKFKKEINSEKRNRKALKATEDIL